MADSSSRQDARPHLLSRLNHRFISAFYQVPSLCRAPAPGHDRTTAHCPRQSRFCGLFGFKRTAFRPPNGGASCGLRQRFFPVRLISEMLSGVSSPRQIDHVGKVAVRPAHPVHRRPVGVRNDGVAAVGHLEACRTRLLGPRNSRQID